MQINDEIKLTENKDENEKGKEDVRWFASNLTEDDLAVISEDIDIKAEDCEIREKNQKKLKFLI